MAKVAFSKLKCKVNETEVPVQIGEETILVKQYLPISEKLGVIGRIIEIAHDQDHNFHNPVKAAVYRDLEILFAYTNLSFTDKQKEDVPKLYDMLASTKVLDKIFDVIPEEELSILYQGIEDTVKGVYQYQNSMLGMLEAVHKQYSNTEFDITNLQNMLNELQDSPVVQQVIPLMGLE